MTQTHAQLRERIAALIDEHVIAVSMSDSWLEGQEEAADAILALLSPPDTGLASVVGEIDALFEGKSFPFDELFIDDSDPTEHIAINVRDHIGQDFRLGSIYGFDEDAKFFAEFICKLTNAYPAIRQALTTGGGWRDDMENAPRGTPVLLKSGLTDRLFIGFNMGDGWIERGSRHVDRPPTHWMPLPQPPQLEGET